MTSSVSLGTSSASRRVAAVFLLLFGALFSFVGLRGLAAGQGPAAAFVLVGVAVMALGVWVWRHEPVALHGNPPVLRANEGVGVAFIVGFAFIWNAVAWPASVSLGGKGAAPGGLSWKLLAFPLVGVLLALYALRVWVRVRRLGRAALTLRPRQPTLGAQFDATLFFEGARAALPREWLARLICEKVVASRGSSGARRRHVLWQHEALARSDGVRVVVRLPVGDMGGQQAHARASSVEHGHVNVRWSLEFEPQGGGVARRFELAIDPFDPQAAPLPPLQAVAPDGGLDAAALRTRLARQGIEIGPASESGAAGQWSFAPRRNGAAPLFLTLGALFAVAGTTLASTAAATGERGAFAGGTLFIVLGSLALALGAMLVTLRSVLRWRDGRVQVAWRSLFGRGELRFDMPQVVRLAPVVSYRSQGGGVDAESLSIKAELADGRWVRLGGGVYGRLETQALLDRLQRAWRLRPERVLRTEAAGRHKTGFDVQWRAFALRVSVAAALLSTLLLAGAAAFPHDFGWRGAAQAERR